MPARRLFYSTDELLRKFKPSLTSTFDVFIDANFGAADNDIVNFSAYEAVIPGSSFELGQVFGDRQGITEQYPTKRVYPPVDVSFYVDIQYNVLEYFERWFSLISNGQNNFRFNYPKYYETDVIITKYEREFRTGDNKTGGNRLKDPGNAGSLIEPKQQIKYTLKNAYPSNLISVPVSYGQPDVLRTTVTFNYDYYDIELRSEVGNNSRKVDKIENPVS